jgi:hypothetical protein
MTTVWTRMATELRDRYGETTDERSSAATGERQE